tara:strand:+ start:372 stop:560 length:189 start_codon:yes stop_codon:yes gene_type:complete
MEDFDTTTPEKTESERLAEEISTLTALVLRLQRQIERLDIRVANLESRRILQADPNDDEEWY